MTSCPNHGPHWTRPLWALFAALTLCGSALAQGYDFKQFLSGGGGGQDPRKKALAQSMGVHICLAVGPDARPGAVRFTVWSNIPQPNARINTIAFDLGRHAGLITGVSVAMASPGVQGRVVPPQVHPFLRGMTPEFWIDIPQKGNYKPDGMGPGRMMMISATLGPGKTINDVYAALHEGLSPVTGANGLRVGVIVLYLLGGPPPGVATIQDDGGFVTTSQSAACQ